MFSKEKKKSNKGQNLLLPLKSFPSSCSSFSIRNHFLFVSSFPSPFLSFPSLFVFPFPCFFLSEKFSLSLLFFLSFSPPLLPFLSFPFLKQNKVSCPKQQTRLLQSEGFPRRPRFTLKAFDLQEGKSKRPQQALASKNKKRSSKERVCGLVCERKKAYYYALIIDSTSDASASGPLSREELQDERR